MRILFVALVAMGVSFASVATSPYVAEQTRSIKGLSDQEVEDYLAGKGMGFAKTAELNGYPGPAHVLELADALGLSPLQMTKTEQVFARMQARARDLGARLVDEERRLDGLFASKAVSRESLSKTLSAIATLQTEIRAVHLEAHLEEAEILSDAQTKKYWHLRGYADAPSQHRHKH